MNVLIEFSELVSRDKKISHLNTVHPNLAVTMAAVLGQTANHALVTDILEPQYTKASYAAKKSKVDPLIEKMVPMAKEPDKITGGEDSYTRPNGDLYYPRPWGDTGHDDVGVLRTAREHNQYVFLFGAPGCGKTALVEAAYGEELYALLGTGDTEVGDLIGGYTQDATGGYVWVDGVLVKAMEEGKPLLVDEVGLIDPKVLSVMYSAMDGRRELRISANPERDMVRAQPGFTVIGATNPHAPGVRLSEALISRFSIHVEVTTDWAMARDKLKVPRDIVSVAEAANKKVDKGEMGWAPQLRELLAYRDLAAIYGTSFAQANLMAGCPEIERAAFRNILNVTAKAGTSVPYPAKI